MPEEKKKKENSVKVYARVRKLMHWEPTELGVRWADTEITNYGGARPTSYEFSDVFDPTCANETVFFSMCEPLCRHVLSGYNAIVIAYGQTGSGKTFTLLGKPKLNVIGMLPKILQYFVDALGPDDKLEVSGVEAFGQHVTKVKIYDLFDEKNNTDWPHKTGSTMMDPKRAQKRKVTTHDECNEFIIKAHANSHFAPTGKNPESSRGHIVFIITVTKMQGHDKQVSHFIVSDLAGSEGESALTGDAVKGMAPESLTARRLEAGCINTGLSDLQGMFGEIKRMKKLTASVGSGLRRCLHPFVNNKTFISVLFCLSPARANSTTTESTLKFATRVCSIKATPLKVKKVKNWNAIVAELEASLREKDERMETSLEKSQSLKQKIVKIFWELESNSKGLGKEIFSKTMDAAGESDGDEDGEEASDEDESGEAGDDEDADSKEEDGSDGAKRKKKKKKKNKRKNSWRSFLNETLFSELDEELDDEPPEPAPATSAEEEKSPGGTILKPHSSNVSDALVRELSEEMVAPPGALDMPLAMAAGLSSAATEPVLGSLSVDDIPAPMRMRRQKSLDSLQAMTKQSKQHIKQRDRARSLMAKLRGRIKDELQEELQQEAEEEMIDRDDSRKEEEAYRKLVGRREMHQRDASMVSEIAIDLEQVAEELDPTDRTSEVLNEYRQSLLGGRLSLQSGMSGAPSVGQVDSSVEDSDFFGDDGGFLPKDLVDSPRRPLSLDQSTPRTGITVVQEPGPELENEEKITNLETQLREAETNVLEISKKKVQEALRFADRERELQRKIAEQQHMIDQLSARRARVTAPTWLDSITQLYRRRVG